MEKKIYHPVHGTGTIKKELFESASGNDTVKATFKTGVMEVKKSEIKLILNS